MRLIQVLFGLLIFRTVLAERLMKFTNVKCKELPTNNGATRYDYCRLKVIRRNYVELSLKVSLLETPVTNISTRLQFFQRLDGYRPFLYNIHFNFCKLMTSKDASVEKFVFDLIRDHTNMNHSCPFYESHFSVDRFAMDATKLNIPFPSGVYRLDFTFYTNKIARTITQVFFEKLD